MSEKIRNKIDLSVSDDDLIWEYFHENSKLTKYDKFPSNQEIFDVMKTLHHAMEFKGHETIKLPESLNPLKMPLDEAIGNRITSRSMIPCQLSLENIATILHYSYGISRTNENTMFPRPFRIVPSAGALYPLEIFFHSKYIHNYTPGIYHYHPPSNSIRLILKGDNSNRISQSLIQKNLVSESSLIIFLTAIFKRSTFKYMDRGYRFALIEAGHVAQNINLVANGIGLGSVNLGGYYDHKIDELLQLDGINQSTIYMIAIGKSLEKSVSDNF